MHDDEDADVEHMNAHNLEAEQHLKPKRKISG